MNKILEDKYYFVKNIEDIVECDMSTYTMKLNMEVKAYYDVCLEDINGMPIGVLAVQFTNPTNITDNQKAMIRAKKIIIEELLK